VYPVFYSSCRLRKKKKKEASIRTNLKRIMGTCRKRVKKIKKVTKVKRKEKNPEISGLFRKLVKNPT
jgi:hypothetical protein